MTLNLDHVPLPATLRRETPFSIEEFWQMSACSPDMRLERSSNGEVLIMTPTQRGTGFRGSQINRALGNWAEQDGNGYEFDSSTGFTLSDGSVLSPDAAWVHRTKWNPAMEDDYRKPLAPNFVIELRSATDSLKKLRDKMQVWIANGVELAWLIDPDRKAVEIYKPGQQPEIQENHSAVYGEGPVVGFVLELARIWS